MVPPTQQSSSRTILVVEDQEQVRAMVVRILEAEGYQVLEAADGVQALELLAGAEVHLIVTDIVMPRMGGFQLAARLAASPDPPILLFISGYGRSETEVPGPLLEKPFTPSTLSAEVRRLLTHKTSLVEPIVPRRKPRD
jgi:two-component system, cell cycle sensor histidine kinase and response regulator CckA